MKILIFRTLAASFLALAFAVVAIAQDGKGTVITIDGLKSVTPAEWKEEAPSNKMRYTQFVLPKAEGDPKDGEIVIFKGLGGSGKANIDRWKEQFSTNDGGKLGEKDFKITEIKVADFKLSAKVKSLLEQDRNLDIDDFLLTIGFKPNSNNCKAANNP